MATTIITKHSVTPGSVPRMEDLKVGELAINVKDGKLFYTDGDEVKQLQGTLDYQLAISIGAIAEGSTIFFLKLADDLKLNKDDTRHVIACDVPPKDNVEFELLLNGTTIGKINFLKDSKVGTITIIQDQTIAAGSIIKINSPLSIKEMGMMSIIINFELT